MADSAVAASGSGAIIATTVLVLVVAGAVGWYVLNQQSAAISRQSIAIATGTAATSGALSKKSKTTVVITGPMDGGKTSLWCHLRFTTTSSKGAVPHTQTSMAVNVADAFVEETQAYLVDVPGHQKYSFDRDAQLEAARAIVFVVDSSAATGVIRQTAETLYDVLAHRSVQQRECPLLVLCNKQDLPGALANSRIKEMLEAEIDSLRSSRQAGLDSLSGTVHGSLAAHDDDAAAEEKASDFLGYDGKKFSFEDLANPVQFNESSMVLGHDAGGLEAVERWIADSLQQ
ncbi:hypothetical protein GGF46_000498 [Coemansia sp. RSA 552]|nr:hypothetical protein GGF46_000498 [Coemansia sp. RSA 552]